MMWAELVCVSTVYNFSHAPLLCSISFLCAFNDVRRFRAINLEKVQNNEDEMLSTRTWTCAESTENRKLRYGRLGAASTRCSSPESQQGQINTRAEVQCSVKANRLVYFLARVLHRQICKCLHVQKTVGLGETSEPSPSTLNSGGSPPIWMVLYELGALSAWFQAQMFLRHRLRAIDQVHLSFSLSLCYTHRFRP